MALRLLLLTLLLPVAAVKETAVPQSLMDVLRSERRFSTMSHLLDLTGVADEITPEKGNFTICKKESTAVLYLR